MRRRSDHAESDDLKEVSGPDVEDDASRDASACGAETDVVLDGGWSVEGPDDSRIASWAGGM
jgi:hypothetical protein